jgi:hypothetical protein
MLRPQAGVQSSVHDRRDEEAGMTTYAPRQDLEAALLERERDAWSRYSASLRELEGRDYENAETDAWAELQRDLRAIDAERVAS